MLVSLVRKKFGLARRPAVLAVPTVLAFPAEGLVWLAVHFAGQVRRPA